MHELAFLYKTQVRCFLAWPKVEGGCFCNMGDKEVKMNDKVIEVTKHPSKCKLKASFYWF